MAGNDRGILAALQKYAHLVQSAARPLPTQTGDGTYLKNDEPHPNLLEDLRALGVSDVKTLLAALEQSVTGSKEIDDKTMFMENLITLASKLPEDSPNRLKLTNTFTKDIWNTLEHPPACGLGDLYNYRQADGSYNNINLPNLGKSGTPYARSVQPRTLLPPAQPDPAQLFDTLMSRDNGGFKPHPGKISSMLFYLATLIIHDVFRTSREDPSISTTTSYLDLGPLYGSNQEEQDLVRTFQDGLLKPDCFSEKRLLGFPPGVSCLVIMFNRFHNYVARQLAAINENGRFSKPAEDLDEDKKQAATKKRDNDLFQTARLVTCGLYINIVMRDYVRTILNMNRTESNWWIDPRADIGDGTKSMGTGNQCSFEFNLIYRWHSCVSERDDQWTRDLYEKLVGKDYHDATTREILVALQRWEAAIPKDPGQRTFEGLQRQGDGSFDDDDLVRILSESVEDLAGAFGANNVPSILRAVEVLGIAQARSWHAATLNELRQFFGLKPHKTFEDINSDPVVAQHLKALYDHPDYVEMYPGVVVEENKPTMVPGSGLATGYTISRAILSDAIALVRGDRHYTMNYHAGNLTNWGLKEVEADPAVEEGCVFSKLFLRAFPDHFDWNSVYAHYPLVVPAENEKILRSLGRFDAYSFGRPARKAPPIVISSLAGVDAALTSKALGVEPWQPGFEFIGGPAGLKACLAGDQAYNKEQRGRLQQCMYPQGWEATVKKFFEKSSRELLQRWSSSVGTGGPKAPQPHGRINGHADGHANGHTNGHTNGQVGQATYQVDIVRDVVTLAGTHFAAQFWALPLKTEQRPHGLFSEHELKDILTLLFIVVFHAQTDPAKTMGIYTAARPIARAFGEIMVAEVRAAGRGPGLGDLVARVVSGEPDEVMPQYGLRILRDLLARVDGDAANVVFAHALTAAAPMVTLNSVIFAQALDYYLGAGREHLPRIQALARRHDDAAADEALLHYALEGVRLNSSGSHAVLRHVHADTEVAGAGGETVALPAGRTVLVRFDAAALARDAAIYPDPAAVRLDRPLAAYRFYGHGPHECLGGDLSRAAQAALWKTVGRLRNLRRAPGPQGRLKTVVDPRTGFVLYMDPLQSAFSPFPTTMKVLYDGEVL